MTLFCNSFHITLENSDNLAKKGGTGEQILSFYYPGSQIQAINHKIFNFNQQAIESYTNLIK